MHDRSISRVFTILCSVAAVAAGAGVLPLLAIAQQKPSGSVSPQTSIIISNFDYNYFSGSCSQAQICAIVSSNAVPTGKNLTVSRAGCSITVSKAAVLKSIRLGDNIGGEFFYAGDFIGPPTLLGQDTSHAYWQVSGQTQYIVRPGFKPLVAINFAGVANAVAASCSLGGFLTPT